MSESQRDGSVGVPMGEFYHTRMVVLVEDSPQSNTYRQVLLTRDQFKAIARCIRDQHESMPCPHEECEGVVIETGEELHRLPTEIRETYERDDKARLDA